MDQSERDILLLRDAVDRTIANPGASHRWLNLMAKVHGLSQIEALNGVLHQLVSNIPDQGLPGFYLALFLDLATGDLAYLGKAARFLRKSTPQDTDRLGAFFHIAWQRALLYSADRTQFIKTLSEIDLPDLAILIGNLVAERKGVSPAIRTIKHVKRVAVVAPHLINPQHPPTQMALDQATMLIKHGAEVALFSCQDPVGPDFINMLGTGASIPERHTDLSEWAQSIGNGSQIYASDQAFSLMRRWLDMLSSISSFDPDLVVFVGLHSGLMQTLYQRYPVLGLGTNSIPPMVPTDVWLTAQAELTDTVSGPWGGKFPESQACYHPYRVQRKLDQAAQTFDGLVLPDKAIALVSIGSHLETSITGPWAERMSEVLSRNPALIWILVGGSGTLPPALSSLPEKRLRIFPHTQHAMAIVKRADIYVNPPVMGGGLSVAEAMSLGLPVLSFADSDGGDKLGHAAVSSFDEYFNKLESLIADQNLRARVGSQMREYFDSYLDVDRSGPSLLAACQLAVSRFNNRIKAVTF